MSPAPTTTAKSDHARAIFRGSPQATRHRERRARVLRSFGASAREVEELLDYNENRFDFEGLEARRFPCSDEPFVEAWQRYADEASAGGAFACLKRHLVQIQFPVREGISKTEAYRDVTLRGKMPAQHATSGEGASLQEPEALRIDVHPTPAGRIPLLITECRADFVTLVQVLTRRNEPEAIPASMGASMVAGYSNWSRIRTHRRAWEQRASTPTEAQWQMEFRRLIPRKPLYQDRFIILSDGPYSAVPAHALGLTEPEWRRRSLVIRREHECAHYFTKRVLSSMQSNILDEFIADYMGIVAAAGRFRADWLLRFMGLESFPAYRSGARLENYKGNPALSDAAFRVLQRLVVEAAGNVEKFFRSHGRFPQGVRALLTFAQLTMEDLASAEANQRISEALQSARQYGDALKETIRSRNAQQIMKDK